VSIQVVFAAMAAIGALIVVMALMSNRPVGSETDLHMDSYNPEANPKKKGGFFETRAGARRV
jgi:hypothetical protein